MNLITVDENGFKPTLALPNASLLPTGSGSDPRLGFVNFRAEEEDAQVRYALFRTTLLEYFGQGSGTGQPELLSLSAQMARKAGFESLVPADHNSRMIRFVSDSELKPISLHSIFVEDLWNHPPLNGGAFFQRQDRLHRTLWKLGEGRVRNTLWSDARTADSPECAELHSESRFPE